ncbi:hypothetical protein Zmor_027938 [Zophobas morio]|uniref:Tyr recombinase domain-containing protein n=1 Tax=Zophobas morio TaxID=2755281 RepID=A0AA38HQ69_9CUCU|nr:hypothetical protein Zmor_027938 [Zophobas morio]
MGRIQYPALSNLARDIWEFCEERNLWLFASYINSGKNTVADSESRRLPEETEYELSDGTFNQITLRFGAPQIDFFASKANHKCRRHVSLLRDPESEHVDAFTIPWTGFFFYAFPPFCLILRCLNKIVRDQAEGIMVVPFWPTQPWYPLFLKLLTQDPLTFAPTYPGSRTFISQAFSFRNVPEEAINTIIHSVAKSTILQYNSTSKMWWSYCIEHKVPMFSATPSQVLVFLQHVLDTTGCRYGTFNSHRSALALTLNYDIGADPLVKRFMKGISQLRPSERKYRFTWDPQIVLDYLGSFFTDNLTLKQLSQKLATLLLLTTGHRTQSIHLIRLSNIKRSSDGIQIFITETIKTSSWTGTQPCLQLPFFQENPSICAATTLLNYLNETEDIRHSSPDYLFIQTRKPHNRASRDTISRWIKEILFEAGVDTDLFTTHSTRHAATSSAFRRGVSLQTIHQTAGWGHHSTVFARFYNCPLHDNFAFARSILEPGT